MCASSEPNFREPGGGEWPYSKQPGREVASAYTGRVTIVRLAAAVSAPPARRVAQAEAARQIAELTGDHPSSAATSDVIRRFLAEPLPDPRPVVIAAFGPGVSIELILARPSC